MNWRLFLVPACLLIFGGCGEKEVEVPISEVADPFPETTPPSPATSEPDIAGDAAPPPRFLPEGEFVVVKRLTMVTDSGIVGADPGTRVQLVKTTGSVLTVASGDAEFEVTSEHLTNDLDVIEAIEAGIAAAKRPVAPSNPAGTQTVVFQQPQQDMPPAPIPPVADRGAELAERRQKLSQQIEQTNQSIRAMHDKVRELNNQQRKGLASIHGAVRASRLASDRNTPEESRIKGLIEKAEAQRNALEQQRRNLQ